MKLRRYRRLGRATWAQVSMETGFFVGCTVRGLTVLSAQVARPYGRFSTEVVFMSLSLTTGQWAR